MARIMYDSINPSAIPRDARLVAGYIDGSVSKWPSSAWNWFPDAVMVRISAIGSTWDADVFDVEPRAIWPPENAVPLVDRARENGRTPTVYLNEMNDWGYTRGVFQRAKVAEPLWWVANYNGRREIPSGSVGRQFAHPGEAYLRGIPPTVPWETGKHFDLSWMVDFWPGVDGDEMALNAETDYAAFKTMMQRFLAFESRDGGAEPTHEKGPTIYERLTAIYNRPVTTPVAMTAEDRDAIVRALGERIPTTDDIASAVIEHMKLPGN